jgi:hypothetical protein
VTTKVATVPVQLPVSLKAAIEKLAEADGISVNQFLVSAAAEKLAAMQSADAFFAQRKGRGDKEAAIRILTRPGGDSPRSMDELPARAGGRECEWIEQAHATAADRGVASRWRIDGSRSTVLLWKKLGGS